MTNQRLIKHLMEIGVLKTKSIINAFLEIDRNDFVADEFRDTDYIYNDEPLPIGYGQTISQPYTVAFMLELLHARVGDNILDIGSGSGWTTALLSQIVGDKGSVLGIEIIPELVEFGQKNLAKYAIANVKITNVNKYKFPHKPTLDKILVSASAQTLPEKYLKALKPNGALVIPIQNSIFKITKTKSGKIEKEEHLGFVFVPLID